MGWLRREAEDYGWWWVGLVMIVLVEWSIFLTWALFFGGAAG